MKIIYMKILGLLCLTLLINISTNAQGCIAVRSGCGANIGGGAILPKGNWQTGTNFRYFKSYKHFRGKHEETERVQLGTEVINHSFYMDFLMSYGLSDRMRLNIILPFVYNERSSMYEHGGNPPNGLGDRHKTSSSGLADIRMNASYWLFDPSKYSNSNISLGLGFKLPSGNYRVKDTFYNQGDEKNETIKSGVDQSIQLGDGGFGITLDAQGFKSLSNNFIISANAYYLINPRQQYGIENRGRSTTFSVPDQYAARVGVLAKLHLNGLYFYAGSRLEGIPAKDLIGENQGFRRPGYIISMEPGINYSIRNASFNLTTPIAIERNRIKNYSDKRTGRHGDAAFADYLINFSFSYRIGKKSPTIISTTPTINI